MTASLQRPSSAQSSRQRDLHPVLSAALSSLDVDLEAELTRYQLAQCAALCSALSQRPHDTATDAVQLSATSTALTTMTHSGALGAITNHTAADLTGADNPFSEVPLEGLNTVTIGEAPSDHSTDAPQTYLASSEALLRSLDEEDTSTAPRTWRLPAIFTPRAIASHLTPLGVGLMLLVGLSSLMATTLVLDARSQRLAQQPQSDTAVASRNGDGDDLSVRSPDLTVGEFTRFSLGRLITLPLRPNQGKTNPTVPLVSSPLATLDSPSSEEGNADLPALAPAPAAVSPFADPVSSVPPAIAPPAPHISSSPSPLPTVPIVAAPPDVALPAERTRTTQKTQPTSASRPTAPASPAAPQAASPAAPQTPSIQITSPVAPTAAPAPAVRHLQPRHLQPRYLGPHQGQPASSANSTSSATEPAAAPTPAVTPATPNSGPASSTAETISPSTTQPPPQADANGSYHHVVTPYTGDRSLESAQEAVSGAYLRNSPSGAQVQFGAFESESSAQELVDQLAEQGIDATIAPE
ncbi:MAG: SPOR domain-containing protein [Cyanobacteria bacterium P01_A01_bin.135]